MQSRTKITNGKKYALSDVADGFEYGMNAAATVYDGEHKYIRITDIDDDTHTYINSAIPFLLLVLLRKDTELERMTSYLLVLALLLAKAIFIMKMMVICILCRILSFASMLMTVWTVNMSF